MLDTRLVDQVVASDWREDENIFQRETRLIEERVRRCGIYTGAAFCDCGHPFVNHPEREQPRKGRKRNGVDSNQAANK